MCGIFGFVVGPQSTFPRADLQKVATRLFVLSESRGKDASGVAVLDSARMTVLKQPQRARELIRSAAYRDLFKPFAASNGASATPSSAGVIGHARMVTNGDKES